jgi:hypothetical protein
MFIASAPIVLNLGQFPQKMPRPRRETTAKTTANDRHMSVGRTIPSTTAALRSVLVPGGGDSDNAGHGLDGDDASVTSQELVEQDGPYPIVD